MAGVGVLASNPPRLRGLEAGGRPRGGRYRKPVDLDIGSIIIYRVGICRRSTATEERDRDYGRNEDRLDRGDRGPRPSAQRDRKQRNDEPRAVEPEEST